MLTEWGGSKLFHSGVNRCRGCTQTHSGDHLRMYLGREVLLHMCYACGADLTCLSELAARLSE